MHIIIAKFRCGGYYAVYLSTLYAYPGTHVLGAEEEAFIEGALVADDSLEFCTSCVIPIFLPIPLTLFNRPDVIIS